MKKFALILIIFAIIFIALPNIGEGNDGSDELDFQVIPDDAIRLRILANSDNEHDQHIKRLVRDEVNTVITEWVEEIDDIDKARELLEQNVPQIREIVQETLDNAGENQNFTVEYNDSVSFPTKIYGDFLYPAGTYEAILITIGEGNGDNWWCVLFPPLCFLDFSSGISVAEASTDQAEGELVEEEEKPKIKFFLLEWLGL
ncbi:stage II sporulation protein R [Ornithinibacillus halophilus]|uniref:Stage II sporulation protein R n=1 Tax=Ornithinibacillus halophilus TaxID=930117 RepID=A0A1M5LEM4_9BACI|nr:stage II sporulation protein R [Ornithinibacillus halophilus]SHG63169.1 stage II sporulation protein R [Ornithinibacillus halophilus]